MLGMNDYISRTDDFMRQLDHRDIGFEVYRVGGSVRDELLGRRVKDADYMVRRAGLRELGDALRLLLTRDQYPDSAVTKLKLRDGRQAGWRVSARGLGVIEIVLPRTDVSTGPGHRDFHIEIDPMLSLADDALRRDFTFNALYKPITDDFREESAGDPPYVLDPTGAGLFDLERGYIRTTHPDSFRDDPLRTLRALRFVSVLGYDLAGVTLNQMAEHASAVTGLSANGYPSGTIYDELKKLLMGKDVARALRIARDTGVLETLLPELAPMIGFEQGSRYHDMTTDEHTFTALETAAHVDAPLEVRMALLFHDSGKPDSAWTGTDGRTHYYAPTGAEAAALRGTLDARDWEWVRPEDHEVVSARIWGATAARLNVDKKMRDSVGTLILNHMVPLQKVNPVKVRRARVELGDELLSMLYMHRMCDLSGKGGASINLKYLTNIAEMENERQRAKLAKVPASAGDLAINGHDVMLLGATGRDVGRVLARVLDEVAVDPSEQKRSREWQLNAALRGV